MSSKALAFDPRRKLALALTVLVLGFAIAIGGAHAQEPVAAEAPLTAAELEDLVGPIALYPDDLIAIVLPASTYPLQIVQAARFLEQRKTDPGVAPDDDWDDSIVALLNYPEVVEIMNDDLDWTWSLGEAVLAQRGDVLDSIQDFRSRARTAGNLQSDDRQVVTEDDGAIAIAPANPEVIYVPYYEPTRVIVHQTAPVVYYHPWSYPVYYYPYPVGYSFLSFRSGFFFGVSTAFGIGWHDRFVQVRPWGSRLHPYFGWRLHDPFYVRNGININVNVNRRNWVWEPRVRRAAQPFARSVGRPVGTYSVPRARRETRTFEQPPTRSVDRNEVRARGQQQARIPGSANRELETRGAARAEGGTTVRRRPDAAQGTPPAGAAPQRNDQRYRTAPRTTQRGPSAAPGGRSAVAPGNDAGVERRMGSTAPTAQRQSDQAAPARRTLGQAAPAQRSPTLARPTERTGRWAGNIGNVERQTGSAAPVDAAPSGGARAPQPRAAAAAQSQRAAPAPAVRAPAVAARSSQSSGGATARSYSGAGRAGVVSSNRAANAPRGDSGSSRSSGGYRGER